ncbi:hypothetical protein ABEF95_004999 [Exophiala dermatitidis]
MPETPKRDDPARRLVVDGSEFWHEATSPFGPIKLGIPLLSPSYRPPPGTIKEPDWLYEEGYLRKPKNWKPKDANAAAPSCPPPVAARTTPPARSSSPAVVVEIRATATKRRLEDEEVEPESNHSSADEDEEDEETMKWVPLPPPGVTLIKAYRSRVPKNIKLQPKKPKPRGKGKGKGKAKEEDIHQVTWIGALGKRGKGQYVVNIKWEGYGYDEMTWEPLENVAPELLDEYWNEHGSPAEQEAEMLPRPPKKTKKTYAGRRSVRK